MLRLLCVTAHPDDEAGAFGGTLLLYASRGVETHLVCLTSGQAATHRGDARDDDELAAIRRRELGRSAEILRLTSWECLHYPDGALDRQDFYSVVGELVRRIRTIRPHVVLTIGPEGAVTAHPDHSMVSVFTTMAYQWAARSNRYTDQLDRGLQPHRAQKLYYGASLFTPPSKRTPRRRRWPRYLRRRCASGARANPSTWLRPPAPARSSARPTSSPG